MLTKIAETKTQISYLLSDSETFKKYVIVGKNNDFVKISTIDIFGPPTSVYLSKSDIANILDVIKD